MADPVKAEPAPHPARAALDELELWLRHLRFLDRVSREWALRQVKDARDAL